MIVYSIISIPVDALAHAIWRVISAALGHAVVDAIVSVEGWFLAQIMAAITRSTTLWSVGGFVHVAYDRSAMIAGMFVLPVLLIAIVSQLRAGTLGSLVELVVLRLPMLVVAVLVFPTVVGIGARVVDAVSVVPLDALEILPTAAKLLHPTIGNTAVAPIVAVVLGVVGLLGAVVLWIELTVRSAAIYLSIVLFPLVALGFVLPWGRAWVERSLKIVFGLLISKFVIAMGVGLGANAIVAAGGSGSEHATALATAGIALMLVAVFAPVVIFRLTAFSEVALVEGITAAHQLVAGRLDGHTRLGQRALSGLASGETSSMFGSQEPEGLPWYRGYDPPEALVEEAKENDWVYQRIYGHGREESLPKHRRGRR
ncbi:MAG: hypothetical protein ACYDHP_05190 [Ferrimicrobium sp.]